MTRRRNARRAKRLQVHFWRQAEPHPFPGYTTNLSTTGMFIATNTPLAQGTRVRVEVLDRDRGFVVEGVVAHARKVRGELARVSQSGMGVRFLSIEELVRELIPVLPGEMEEIPDGPVAGPPRTVFAPAPPPPEPDRRPAGTQPSPVAGEPFPPAAVPSHPVQERSSEPPAAAAHAAHVAGPPGGGAPPPAAVRPPEAGAFSVQFASVEDFLQIYERDILNGGLFVPTRYPGRLQELVEVDILPPDPFAEPVRLRARVVQRFEPHSGDLTGVNLLSGMGLELLDLPRVVERLRPVVDRLRK
jgi:Tfp pilus assembly protein PilZ